MEETCVNAEVVQASLRVAEVEAVEDQAVAEVDQVAAVAAAAEAVR